MGGDMTAGQAQEYSPVARACHWVTAALVLTTLPIGITMVNVPNLGPTDRAPVLYFWMFELPPIWKEARAFSEALFKVHVDIGILILTLVSVHIAAALYHHFVLRDRVLKGMVSG
jgi:cytochrome b561